MSGEEVKDVPLVWPLVSVTLKTVNMVDGRPVLTECEEVINMQKNNHISNDMSRLGREFKAYVRRVIDSASSPQTREALQNILDNHARPAPLTSEDHPSSPQAQEAIQPGNPT